MQTRYTRTQPPPAEGQSTYYSLEEVASKLLDISRRKGFHGESKIGTEELEVEYLEPYPFVLENLRKRSIFAPFEDEGGRDVTA